MAKSQITTRAELNKKESKWLDTAIKENQKKNYKKSNQLFSNLLKSKPNFLEGKMRLGTSYFNQKNYTSSENLIKEVIDYAPDFDVEVYYTLANVQRAQKKYLEAGHNYKVYLTNIDTLTEKAIKAKRLRDQMFYIHDAINNPVSFIPYNPGPNINTYMSEYLPLLSLDGSQLYFTRNVKFPQQFIGQEDIYFSQKDSLGWREAIPVPDVNTANNEGAFTLSADGKTLVFTVCDRWDTYGGCDLYSSVYKNGEWSQVVNMGKEINTAAWDSQPALSADGKTMIFSSKRLGTLGGSDLWITQRAKNNAWTLPKNMGSAINTPGNEESPFLHPDGKTLYFRSDGRLGMGGFDIYYTRYNDTTELWSPPQNIGYPINTEGHEGAMTVSLDGTTAWYATDMNHASGELQNNLDIYYFDLPHQARSLPTTFVKGKIKDGATLNPLSATIIIKDLITHDTIYTWQSDEDGNFISPVTSGKNYVCIVSLPGYTYFSYNIDLQEYRALYKPYILDVVLWPIMDKEIEEEPSFILNNIFFKLGSYELKPESITEILLISHMMKENSDIDIILIGHTDSIGSYKDNQLLSENRAKSVAQAIINQGVNAQRISTLGMGSTQPIDDNATEEGREKNRRTEMKVVRNKR